MESRQPWLEHLPTNIPISAEDCFPLSKGFGVRRANTKRAKLASATAPVLERAFDNDERLLYISQGILYSSVEMLFAGALAAQYSSLFALALTNKRLFLLQVSPRGKLGDIKNSIAISNILKAKHASFGRLRLHLADKRRLLFVSIRRADSKALIALIQQRVSGEGAEQAKREGLAHLCPRCMKAVDGKPGDIEKCPHGACGIPFRRAAQAAKLSGLLPGWGDLYLRHFAFGAFEIFGSVMLAAMAFALIPGALAEGEYWGAALLAWFCLAMPRLVDIPLTFHMARKGIVPLTYQLSTSDAGVRLPGWRNVDVPAFPRWARTLIAFSVVACIGAAVFGVHLAQQSYESLAAARLVAADPDAALEQWKEQEALGTIDNEGRGKLVYALYEAGDLQGGNQVLEALGDAEISIATADAINGFLTKHDAAVNRYNEGVEALLRGDEQQAWVAIDPSLRYFAHIKRPTFPQDRSDVLIDLAIDLAGYGENLEDIVLASKLLERVDEQAQRARPGYTLARGMIARKTQDAAAARQLLASLDVTQLTPSHALLALDHLIEVVQEETALRAVEKQLRDLDTSSFSEDELAYQKELLSHVKAGRAARAADGSR